MSRPYKYRSISLRYNTYSTLEDLSNIVVKGHKLSNAKTAEIAIENLKENLSEANAKTAEIAIENLKENLSEEISNSKSRTNGVTNGKTQKEA